MSSVSRFEFQSEGEPFPFEDLFISTVLRAREALQQQVRPDAYNLLTPSAHSGWERYLLKRLTWISAKAAHWQFQIHKTVSQAFGVQESSKWEPTASLYRAFVEDPDRRLENLLQEFPLLRHLHAVLVGAWVSTVTEFLERLEIDHSELGARFYNDANSGRVLEIQPGLSDPHRGGRCVARVIFEGVNLIYKPRSVVVEHHFRRLLDLMNASQIPNPLIAADCWDRNEYGWMEDVAARPCASLSDVETFYWRSGAMLCLVYLAEGVDIHQQNVVAAGEYPILIDLETLWHPHTSSDEAASSLHESVIRTGFLPASAFSTGLQYEWSALSRTAPQGRSGWRWLNVNENEMAWGPFTEPFGHSDHLPLLNGSRYSAARFVGDIQEGFRWIANLLLTQSTTREKFNDWLRALSRCPRRHILRSSELYQPLTESFTSPTVLRGGVAIDDIWKEISTSATPYSAAEVQALKQLDVPYFTQRENEEQPRPKLQPSRLSTSNLLNQEQLIAASLT